MFHYFVYNKIQSAIYCSYEYRLKFFSTKFQTTFVVCFSILTNYSLETHLYLKLSNSIDALSYRQIELIEPSHLDLCCLQKPIIIVFGSERIKGVEKPCLKKQTPKSYLRIT